MFHPTYLITCTSHTPTQVRRHTEAAAEELRRADEQEEQLTKAGASELAVSCERGIASGLRSLCFSRVQQLGGLSSTFKLQGLLVIYIPLFLALLITHSHTACSHVTIFVQTHNTQNNTTQPQNANNTNRVRSS